MAINTDCPAGVYARVYHQGYSAALHGHTFADCPYESNTRDYVDWSVGYETYLMYAAEVAHETAEAEHARVTAETERAALKAEKQRRHQQNKVARANANRARRK